MGNSRGRSSSSRRNTRRRSPSHENRSEEESSNQPEQSTKDEDSGGERPLSNTEQEHEQMEDGTAELASTSHAHDLPEEASGAASEGDNVVAAKPSPRRHYTRSRNPSAKEKKSKKQDYSSDSTSTEDEISMQETIDSAAKILASVDDRSYRRALLRDANGMLEGYTFPMSFPWQHRCARVARNMAHDIDEMPVIRNFEDESVAPFSNGPFDFGKFQVGHHRRGVQRTRSSQTIGSDLALARRSDDPGVIELSTMKLPECSLLDDPSNSRKSAIASRVAQGGNTSSQRRLSVKFNALADEEDVDDERIPGELSLRSFHRVQGLKRKRVEQALTMTKVRKISVRLATVSSRSKIFEQLGQGGRHPILIPALLPAEVQNGKTVRVASAKAISEQLGSYDCSYRLQMSNSKNASRVTVGRTRLMWTRKYAPDQAQKGGQYASILTGEKLDPGVQRRPREARVGIRLNGSLLSYDALPQQMVSESCKKSDPLRVPLCDPALMGKELIQKALDDESAGVDEDTCSRLLCTLDCGKFIHNIVKARKAHRASMTRGERRRTLEKNLAASPQDISNGKDPLTISNYVPPRIDCLPGNDGLICTVCSAPGTLECHGAVFPSKDTPVCSVCWFHSGDKVEECCCCGVQVHLGCVKHRGLTNTAQDKWACFVCVMKDKGELTMFAAATKESETRPKRATSVPARYKNDQVLAAYPTLRSNSSGLKCSFCPHSGGAVSPIRLNGEELWIHEVCRIWGGVLRTTAEKDKKEKPDKAGAKLCAICGTGSSTKGDGDHEPPDSASERQAYGLALTRCAASCCQVYFHPFCAQIVSRLTEQTFAEPSCLNEAKRLDAYYCTQYTLDMQKVSWTEVSSGSKRSAVLPVAFCGIHNPKRERSLYGFYPAGAHLSHRVMRIPFQRESGIGASLASVSMEDTSTH